LRLPVPLLLLAFAAGGCRGPAPVSDQRPERVERSGLSSTVWIGCPTEVGIAGYASAVVLGPRRLLTNAHVWAVEQPWWEHELPQQRELLLYEPARELRVRVGDRGGVVEAAGRLAPCTFRLVAAGAPATDGGRGDGRAGPGVLAADWALIEADTPRWPVDQAATLHPAAIDGDWTAPEGTELLLAGFSSIFMGEDLRAATGPGGRPVDDAWELLEPFLAQGPYTVRGEAVLVDGHPAARYTPGWPQPAGHSGGGVYVWDPATGQARLVGVFHSWMPTLARVVRRYEPLGLSALGFDHTVEQKEWALVYAPIAPALRAADVTRH
jgi:hypothetical protein